jgi:ribosomal protein L40E
MRKFLEAKMICFKCQAENPENAKYCNQCGVYLADAPKIEEKTPKSQVEAIVTRPEPKAEEKAPPKPDPRDELLGVIDPKQERYLRANGLVLCPCCGEENRDISEHCWNCEESLKPTKGLTTASKAALKPQEKSKDGGFLSKISRLVESDYDDSSKPAPKKPAAPKAGAKPAPVKPAPAPQKQLNDGADSLELKLKQLEKLQRMYDEKTITEDEFKTMRKELFND